MQKCEIRHCNANLNGGAAVGYVIDNKTFEIKVCAMHLMQISTAPRGSFRITARKELKAIPARQHYI